FTTGPARGRPGSGPRARANHLLALALSNEGRGRSVNISDLAPEGRARADPGPRGPGPTPGQSRYTWILRRSTPSVNGLSPSICVPFEDFWVSPTFTASSSRTSLLSESLALSTTSQRKTHCGPGIHLN